MTRGRHLGSGFYCFVEYRGSHTATAKTCPANLCADLNDITVRIPDLDKSSVQFNVYASHLGQPGSPQ